MFTIHSLMLVSLGFLFAVLLGFVMAPAYWARAVRLTTERLRRSLPMTEAEIRAERDKLRAQNAVRIHRLEAQTERARLSAARQRVEINRRDGRISTLERQVRELQTNLEASDNARRVLEQTIVDRVPKIEARLIETRKLLDTRDEEIDRIKTGASKTFQALDEAMQINAQQRGEIDRLRSSLATRTGTDSSATPRYDTEIALRSELEELRARTRDQASLISKLQDMARTQEQNRSKLETAALANTEDGEVKDTADTAGGSAKILHLNPPKTAIESDDPPAPSPQELTTEALNAEVATLKSANRAQSLEIDKLKAELQVFEAEAADDSSKPAFGASLRDSKVALRARLSAAEKETTRQAGDIQRLRAELASANDRLARQAAQFREELRRLGSGTVPASARGRRAEFETVTAEPAQPEKTDGLGDATVLGRPSLARRITEEFPDTAAALESGAPTPPPALPRREATNGKPVEQQVANGHDDDSAPAKSAEKAAPPSKAADPSPSPARPRRQSLMDRIARMDKS